MPLLPRPATPHARQALIHVTNPRASALIPVRSAQTSCICVYIHMHDVRVCDMCARQLCLCSAPYLWPCPVCIHVCAHICMGVVCVCMPVPLCMRTCTAYRVCTHQHMCMHTWVAHTSTCQYTCFPSRVSRDRSTAGGTGWARARPGLRRVLPAPLRSPLWQSRRGL